MKTETIVLPVVRNWPADIAALAKPRIAVMVLFTVAIGALLAQRTAPNLLLLLHTMKPMHYINTVHRIEKRTTLSFRLAFIK